MKYLKYTILIIITFIWVLLQAIPPDWEVITGTEYSMVLMAQVSLNGELFNDLNNNMVGAFGPGGDNDCRSLGVWQEGIPPIEGFWYFTIVGNQEDQGEEIFFKIYDDSSDQIFNCLESVIFQDNQTIGTPSDPFQFSVTAALGYVTGTVFIDGEDDPQEVLIQAGNVSTHPDSEGSYLLTLIPGVYEISASLEGYISDPLSYQGIFVEEDQTTEDIDFNLEQIPSLGLALPATIQGYQGMSLELPITLYNTNNIGIEGIGITISFDEQFLSAIDASLTGGVLPEEDYSLYTNLENPGELSLTIVANGTLFNGNGEIVFLFFEVETQAPIGESCEISFLNSQINEQTAQTYNCIFTVSSSQYQISGACTYYFNSNPIPNAEITISGTDLYTSLSDEFGYYLVSGIIGGNYTSHVSKENDLGGLSGTDASRVARFSVDLYEFDCQQMIAADVTMNGSISPTDASRIARYAAELIDDMNSGTNWIFLPEPVLNCEDWPPITYNSMRSYNPLSSDLDSEDFIGIRLGDVSGNWTQDDLRTNQYKVYYQGHRDDPTASLPNLEIETGTLFETALTATNLTELEGMEITVEYDHDIIHSLDATLDGGILENQNYTLQINTNNPGEIILVLYANQDLFSGEGIILYIEFEAIGDNEEISPLTFTRYDVNETDFLANTNDGSVTLIESSQNGNSLPSIPRLSQNHPNPFNPNTAHTRNGSATEINYDISERSQVNLSIFNVKGQLIRTLINEIKIPGSYSIGWNGRDNTNREVPSGIYFYKLKTDNEELIKKAVLFK